MMMTVALRLLSAAMNSTLNNAEGTENHLRRPRHSNSDSVVILAALLCALLGATGLAFVIRFSSCFSVVARLSCLQVCFSNWAAQPAPPPPSVPPPPGLKKAALLSLPTAMYSSTSSSGLAAGVNLATACSICLVEFSDGDLIRILPVCGHVFHMICVDEWLCCSSSCPCCRGSVPLVFTQCKLCGGCGTSSGAGEILQRESTLA